MRHPLLALLAVFALAAFAGAQDKTIDNPEYTGWAKFKPGTAATLKVVNEFGGMKSATNTTTKLVSVADGKLVVEATIEVEVMGQKIKQPAVKRDVPKTLSIKAGFPVPMGGKPEGTTEEGTETLKVGGASYKTTWYKYTTKTPAGEVSGQVWTSDDVPGQVVKMVTKAANFSMTMELVEVTKP